MPDTFNPTEKEIDLLRTLRFIDENRAAIENLNANPQVRQNLAEVSTHLSRAQGESTSMLGGLITLTQVFPLQCVNFRITSCTTKFITMEADFPPDWRIEAILNGDGKIVVEIFLVINENLMVPINKEFFAGHTLAEFLARINKPMNNKAKQIVVKTLEGIVSQHAWDRHYRRPLNEEQKVHVRACTERIKADLTRPIRSGYRFP